MVSKSCHFSTVFQSAFTRVSPKASCPSKQANHHEDQGKNLPLRYGASSWPQKRSQREDRGLDQSLLFGEVAFHGSCTAAGAISTIGLLAASAPRFVGRWTDHDSSSVGIQSGHDVRHEVPEGGE